MAIKLDDKIAPSGNFPIVDAADVAMPDGTRLLAQPIVRVVDELPSDAANNPNVVYLIVEDEDTPEDGGSP